MKKLLIVAGESSGDLHGANLAKALSEESGDLRILGLGGPRMRAAGVEIAMDVTRYSAVGLVEALRGVRRFLGAYKLMKSLLVEEKPDAVVSIDFPEFNLRFAGEAHKRSVPVIYYIGPQIWAWRAGRLKKISRFVRKMLVIFDFEVGLYRKAGVDTVLVGHPLLDVLAAREFPPDLRQEMGVAPGAPLIGLLPGSRERELARLLPIMTDAAARIAREVPGARFVVCCAPGIDPDAVRKRLPSGKFNADVVRDRTYEVMKAADLLIVASGTATLEAAILGTPMIVVYKVSWLTYWSFVRLIGVSDCALANIVAGRRIVPEFIQGLAKPRLIAREALSLLSDSRQTEMRGRLEEVRLRLGPPGASRRAAREILKTLEAAG